MENAIARKLDPPVINPVEIESVLLNRLASVGQKSYAEHSDTDDLQPIIDSLQAQIADKDKQIVDKDQLIADLKEALLKLQEQNDSLQAQIAAAQTGGDGAKDAKESKPANSK